MNEAKPAPPVSTVLASAAALKRFTYEVFRRAGMSEDHAELVADVLVWANLRGMDSHGVMRVPRYVELVQRGDLNVTPVMTLKQDTLASVLIDADRAAGPVAMVHATRIASRKAKEAGIGLALVRGTTHTAALGYYTQMAARDGFAAIALAASGPNMAYHGARAAGVSTAPLSIAVPGPGHEPSEPIALDMGSGMVSIGKLAQVRRAGQAIPSDWALDSAGNPTIDSQAAAIPLPLGGAKGSGLALMAECLSSLIVAHPLLAETLEGTQAGARHRQNALVIAIDIARFVEPKAFQAEVARLVRNLKALPPQADVGEILMPGERGHRSLQKRSRDGVPIPRKLADELQRMAERLGVPWLDA